MLQIFIIFYHAFCFLSYIGLPIKNQFLFTTGCIVNKILNDICCCGTEFTGASSKVQNNHSWNV